MSEKPQERPRIFISHAHDDGAIVAVLSKEIDKLFAKEKTAFATGIPEDRRPGEWLEEIKENLKRNEAMIVIITPISIRKHWIWVEFGAYWGKNLNQSGENKEPIYVIYINVPFESLPRPISDFNGWTFNKTEDVKAFFNRLKEDFDLAGEVDPDNIHAQIAELSAKYPVLKTNARGLDVGVIYFGSYGKASDGTLKELLDDYLSFQYRKATNKVFDPAGSVQSALMRVIDPGNRIGIFRGQVILYNKIDEQLDLPPGTSKRLLKEVAEKYGLVPVPGREHEDSIRFQYNPDLDIFRNTDE